jgi:putative transposase
MCQVLGVSPSGYYDHLRREKSKRALEDERLTEMIVEVHEFSMQTYGYRRIRAELARRGVSVNAKRVRRLMRLRGIQGHTPRLKRRIRQIGAVGVHAPDLVLRDWNPTQPNKLWVADITYVRTWQGWLYLAAIMDAHSRRIVGWSMQPHMRAELVQDALDMAVTRRRPAAGLVHHTDHGSQYTALTFGAELRRLGIEPSMGRVRTCYDNAVAESFFATLKKDLVNRYSWPTRHDAQTAIFDFIERWYNNHRLHSTLGYLPPAEYEQLTQAVS